MTILLSTAVHFSVQKNKEKKSVDYKIFYKRPKTSTFAPPNDDFNPSVILQKSIDEPIVEHFLNRKIEIKMSKKKFPTITTFK